MGRTKKKLPTRVVVETHNQGAKITRPDGTVCYAYCLDDMMDHMLEVSYRWSDAEMEDRRGWKFPGEA
jgi:hypothetical protein